jgi:hypothetical protein
MTKGFQPVLAASDEERRDLFVGAADRLRTNEQNIEKDFWVVGRSTRSSTNWRPVARACSSKAEPRSPKVTA